VQDVQPVFLSNDASPAAGRDRYRLHRWKKRTPVLSITVYPSRKVPKVPGDEALDAEEIIEQVATQDITGGTSRYAGTTGDMDHD
jgi:hypothetical protein